MLAAFFKNSFALIRRNDGVSLVTAILVSLILSALGYATIHAVIMDAHLTGTHAKSTQAFWLAEAGVERGLHYLRNANPPPRGTAPLKLFNAVEVGGGKFTVALDPDDRNAKLLQKKYKIVATGDVGDISRKIEIQVKTVAFGNFVYLSGKEGGTIWFSSSDLLDGPIHTNDQFAITGSPTFKGKVTSVATSFKKRGSFHPDFQKGYQLGVPPVVFPTSNEVISNYKALSGKARPPLVIDATSKRNASIVFKANGTMVYSVWKQGGGDDGDEDDDKDDDKKKDKKKDKEEDNDEKEDDDGKKNFIVKKKKVKLNTLNGIVVIKGDVTIEGKIKGQLTLIATGNIYINGDLVYDDANALGKPPKNSKNLLGLVSAKNIILKKDVGKGRKGVRINAAMLALRNSFTVENYNRGKPRGKLTIYGSLSQSIRGPVGTFNQFGATAGFEKDYHYDQRLAKTPPPFFPTTGQYEIFDWKESE